MTPLLVLTTAMPMPLRTVGNSPTDPSMNVLYCDGHADFLSVREAYRGLRFK